MDNIPLIFALHLSVEQKNELLSICSEISTILHHYQSISLEVPLLNKNALLSIISDISTAVHNNQFKHFKFTSYNLRISIIKLSFILDQSSTLTSVSSAIIDKALISCIAQIEQIIIDGHELLLSS